MRLSPSQVAYHIGAACRLACRNCVHFGYCCSHRQSGKWARQGRLGRRCRSPFRPLFSGLYAPLDTGCRRRSPGLSSLRPRGLEPLTCGLGNRRSILPELRAQQLIDYAAEYSAAIRPAENSCAVRQVQFIDARPHGQGCLQSLPDVPTGKSESRRVVRQVALSPSTHRLRVNRLRAEGRATQADLRPSCRP